MADVHDKKTRSYNMSKIRGKDTKPEMIVRKFLHAQGFRYRLHDKKLPGKPDIVLPKYKTIIDVRGCFWHCHKDCNKGDKISTTSEIVSGKRISAVKRDKIKSQKWKELGWRVIIIWTDCELEPKRKKSIKREVNLNRLMKILKIKD
ncbi:DNA mismatch endonuclease Vsr [Salegentibacter sp. F63223]|nr:DNA mismatch endonuclease Vsr [Salegentibacter maritimus]